MKYLKKLRNKLFAEITTVPVIVQDSYYPSLDGLRGIAILMVILYHFSFNRFLRPFHFLINGELGVNIFFVISGFLITTLLLKEKLAYGKISLKRFYTRRALRIIPVAYLFLIILIILNNLYKIKLPASAFISSFLFYKNFPYQFEPYSGHFWSLAAEVQFYLIFPFLLVWNTNRYMIIVISIVIVVPVISILGFYHAGFLYSNHTIHLVTQITMYSFWNGPFIILIGSLASIFLFKGVISIEKNKGNYFLSFLLLLIAITISNKLAVFYSKYLSEYVSAILIAWIILLNLKKSGLLSAILTNPVFVKVGIISYSLYVWQELFVGNRSFPPWMKPFHNCPLGLFVMLKLVSVFLIAFASYYFFEKKFLKIKIRFL